MFHRRPPDADDGLDELDTLTADEGIASGIRKALERTDLTAEDRAQLQAALENLKTQPSDEATP